MHKIKEYGAPIILAGLTLTTVGTATVASYMVGKDALGLPLAILFPIPSSLRLPEPLS